MSREAYLERLVTDQDATMRHTPGVAVDAGEVIKINISATKAIAGIPLADIAANTAGAVDIKNIYRFPCGAAQTFSEGDQVYWDNEGSKAIPEASSNGADDFCLGSCVKTRAATDSAFVSVRLNYGPSQFIRESSSSSSSSS